MSRIYAELMDRAVGRPMAEIQDEVQNRLLGTAQLLSGRFLELLREAYMAGCHDGYAEAIRDASNQDRDPASQPLFEPIRPEDIFDPDSIPASQSDA